MRPMLGMLIFPHLGKGCGPGVPIAVDIGGVRQGVSELVQAVYTKPLGICCGFRRFCFNCDFKFWVPQFLGKGYRYGCGH